MIALSSANRRSRRSRRGNLVAALLLVAALAGCEREPPGPLTVTEIAGPAGDGAAQPRLLAGPGGSALLSWLEPDGDNFALRFSTLAAGEWQPARTLAAADDWFVNWADTPSVLPASDEIWAAHWLRYQPESFFAYDILISFSKDVGASWSEPRLLHQDGTESEHGFVTLFPDRGGVGAVWLDGRNYLVDGVYLYEDPEGNKLGTGLHYARFDPAGQQLESVEIDEMVCDCCLPDVAHAPDGPVVAYRDRTTTERRDIVVRRMQDGAWQDPVPVGADNWTIEACPINGPAIAADGNDVAVAWFTAANGAPFVRLARSDDGGRSFGEPMDLDSGGSFGHVDIVLSESGDAVVSWLRSADQGIGLVIRQIANNGRAGDIQTIANIDIGRPADFPQMIEAGGRLVFAWTDFDGAGTVRTAVAQLDR